jgi:hypothetical protein
MRDTESRSISRTSIPTGEFLASLGLPPGERWTAQESPARFPDGAHFRIEIPSVEGPRCLEAVLAEAERLAVPVTRISQGTGIDLLTDGEIRAMARDAAGAAVELSLYARPCAGWGTSAMARTPGGAGLGAAAHGQDQVAAALGEIRRAAELGIRSVLIADLGVLAVFGEARAAGLLPDDMQAKLSVMLPVANPAAARVVAGLGADTINLPTDLTAAQAAAIRAAVTVPVDMYIEAPDNLGGFMRYHQLAELIAAAAPLYAKFGLRNAPDVYPSGSHLEDTAVALSRERVRRARLGLDLLARSGAMPVCSTPGAKGLAIPVL